jgi:hypothetical protein
MKKKSLPIEIDDFREFKQGEDIAKLKKEALQQILDNRYYAGLQGEALCLGIAHNKKKCEIAYCSVQGK